MSADPLYVLAGLALAGVVAQALASRLHLPSIVFLLAIGLSVGPVFGLLDPDVLFGPLLGAFVSLSVALVLFEGGLSLKWQEARKLGAPLWRLVFGGLLLSFSLTFGFGLLAGLSWPTAGVIAAILIVTGPTVIKPMLRQARLAQRPARLLRWEGIVNDPIGALLAVMVVELALLAAERPEASTTVSLLSIGWRVVVAGGAGSALGWLLGVALERAWVPQHLKIPAIVAGVVTAFAGAEALFHEAGLLAVTAMGVVLANAASQSVEAIRHFKEEVATLLVAFLFLVLAANLSRADLLAFTPGSILLVIAILFVVRPASVWLAMAGSGLSWKEKLLIGWIAPRGIVAAAMAGVLAPQVADAGYEDARLILPVIFGVILLTVLLHGFTLAPLARRLDLAGSRQGGLMLVGLSSWARDLARAVTQAGAQVLCVDGDRRQTASARLAGLPAAWADVLIEDDLDDLPLERMRWLLAASPDDHFNQLACLTLGKTLGSDLVLQLSPRVEGRGDREGGLGGRTPWGERATYDEISARYWKGARFKVTELTEQFDGDAFLEKNPAALVLFDVREARLEPVREDEQLQPGDKLVWLP